MYLKKNKLLKYIRSVVIIMIIITILNF